MQQDQKHRKKNLISNPSWQNLKKTIMMTTMTQVIIQMVEPMRRMIFSTQFLAMHWIGKLVSIIAYVAHKNVASTLRLLALSL